MGVIEKFYQSAADRTLALMLDLDGATLHRKPAIHNPVEPDLAYDAALRMLAENNCPVSINTGRPEIFVNNVFPFLTRQQGLPLYIATETGAKIIGPNKIPLFSKAVPNIAALRARFAAEAEPYEGAIIEDHKMCAITISLKHCPDSIRTQAYDHMVTAAEKIKRDDSEINVIAIWKANDVYIEIVPNGVDKGTATLHMLDQAAFTGKTVFAFGDSKADEPMMAAVRDRGGYAIGVGEYIERHVQDINFTDYHVSQHHIQNAARLASGQITMRDVAHEFAQPKLAV